MHKIPALKTAALFVLLTVSVTSVLAQNPVYRVYLIGDTGGANFPGSLPTLETLRKHLDAESENAAVVFLGDNIYCCGLPHSSSIKRDQAEMRLEEALAAVESFKGKTVFIPGNHDWGTQGEYSRETLRRQQLFVEERLGKGSFLPTEGFPGPVEVKLTKDIRLIVIDTQWWLMDEKPFGDTGEYDLGEEGDFLLELRDLLAKRDDEHVLLAGHHPMLSFGEHGGRYPLKAHLFPLTEIWENAWLPFPIIGSLYPLMRSASGGRQDLSNPKYRSLRNSLTTLLRRHDGNIIYASGHDHNLQHIQEGKTHYLVSGSASRPSYVSKTRAARFTSSEPGFMVLDYDEDGSVHLRIISASDDVIYESPLFGPSNEASVPVEKKESSLAPISGYGTSVSRPIVPSFGAGFLKTALMGSHHRLAWTTPVSAEVFDISEVRGGLTPLKRGGGLQTTSLRLQDSAGNQFVLRSIEKDPTKSIPIELQATIAASVLKDQTSILLPFSALMVPPLARAAGIYYSTPKMYFVPRDPLFGVFTDLVADQMMLFEQRPDDDMSAFPEFGNSGNVISSPKMFRNLFDDNDNRVDSRFFARSRLFDMYISDWDRHQDQWRWASFDDPDGKGDLYRPIPRDRDWAFNRMNGFFPSIIKSQWVIPRFQDFRPEFGFILGLNGNGMVLDRRFTASLSEEDWIQIASEIQSSITEESMQEAVDQLPVEVKPFYEEEIFSTLLRRRSQLTDVASEYYRILAALVDVVGSDKHERFVVTAYKDSVVVIMNKTSKSGEHRQEMFKRTFYANETEEIRLYGLGGDDRFEITGTSEFSIRIYAVGGSGEDSYTDLTSSPVVRKNWFVRDTPNETVLRMGAATRNQLMDDASIQAYNPYDYWFEALLPKIRISSNQENGIVLGGGFTHTSNVFHRSPFSTRHTFAASFATRTRAFAFQYDGLFNQRLGEWGVAFHVKAETEGSLQNFYGFGSNTKTPVKRASFYESELETLTMDLGVFRDWGTGITWNLSSLLEFAEVDESKSGFATSPESGLEASEFGRFAHAGLATTLESDRRDNRVYPLSGYHWLLSARTRFGVNDASQSFTQFSSHISFYYTPGSGRKTTLATRFGVSHVGGDFPFFRAASVGNETGLRGWRKDRFAGNTAAYVNLEARRELFTFSSLLAAGRAGINAFIDDARVWYGAEDNANWHQGFGAGIWINFFDMTLFQISLASSEEEIFISTGLGFEF